MPTDLPRSKRSNLHPVRGAEAPKQSLFAKLLNTFMIGSAIVLFALVVLQEKHYIDGNPGSVADGILHMAQAALGAQDDGASPD